MSQIFRPDFERIVRSLTDLVFVTDLDGTILFINDAVTHTLGAAADELEGRKLIEHVDELDSLHIVGFASLYEPTLACDHQVAFAGRVGEPFRVELSATWLTSASGDRIGLVLLGRSTERMREELAETSRFAAREQERADALHLAQEALKEKNLALREAQRSIAEASRAAAVGEMLSGVLHNLGNVLNSVQTSTKMARETVEGSRLHRLGDALSILREPDLAEKRRLTCLDYLDRLANLAASEHQSLLETLERLADRTEQMTVLLSEQAHRANPVLFQEVVDLETMIRDAVGTALPDDHGDLVQIDGQGARLRTDRHRVLQILINLLRNARDAVSGEREPAILVSTTVDRSVEIRVKDNGVGIAPSDLTRIFQHGFTRKEDGHGFGLHASANTAALLGGSLTSESEGLGSGATFILQLPLDEKVDASNS